MMPEYFDIHSHLNFKDLEKDLEGVLERMRETNTHTIVVGTDFESSQKAVDLADKHEGVYASIGVHPVDDPRAIFEREKFEKLVEHPKVVAIGECGFDFFRLDKFADYERQKELFLTQIRFALDFDKPLMIHSREAYLDLLKILEPMKLVEGEKLRGDIHFFAGAMDTAERFVQIGFTLSFTGVITFAHDYDPVIRNIPLEMIMSETDAPFVPPAAYRGKTNEPSYVSEVAKRIAEIKGEDLETVKKTLVSNAFRMFGISAWQMGWFGIQY